MSNVRTTRTMGRVERLRTLACLYEAGKNAYFQTGGIITITVAWKETGCSMLPECLFAKQCGQYL